MTHQSDNISCLPCGRRIQQSGGGGTLPKSCNHSCTLPPEKYPKLGFSLPKQKKTLCRILSLCIPSVRIEHKYKVAKIRRTE